MASEEITAAENLTADFALSLAVQPSPNRPVQPSKYSACLGCCTAQKIGLSQLLYGPASTASSSYCTAWLNQPSFAAVWPSLSCWYSLLYGLFLAAWYGLQWPPPCFPVRPAQLCPSTSAKSPSIALQLNVCVLPLYLSFLLSFSFTLFP
jgi:hypothetical protein